MKLILALLAVLGVLPVYKDPSAPETKRVEDLLSRMTLHEKVMQLNQYTIGRNDNANNIGESVKNVPAEIGSLIYFAEDPGRAPRKLKEAAHEGVPPAGGKQGVEPEQEVRTGTGMIAVAGMAGVYGAADGAGHHVGFRQILT